MKVKFVDLMVSAASSTCCLIAVVTAYRAFRLEESDFVQLRTQVSVFGLMGFLCLLARVFVLVLEATRVNEAMQAEQVFSSYSA